MSGLLCCGKPRLETEVLLDPHSLHIQSPKQKTMTAVPTTLKSHSPPMHLECCDVHRLKNLVCWHCLNTLWFWLSPTNSCSIVIIKTFNSPKPDSAAGLATSLVKLLWPSHQFSNMKTGPDTPSAPHFRDCQSQHLLWELPRCIWILGCLINPNTWTLQIAGREIKSPSNACHVPRTWYILALQKIVCFWIDNVSCLVHLCHVLPAWRVP